MAYLKIEGHAFSGAILLGSGTSYDIKTLYPTIYSKLTADNFIVEVVSSQAHAEGDCTASSAGNIKHGSTALATITKTYSTDGVLTIGGTSATYKATGANASGYLDAEATVTVTYKVYMVPGKIKTS